MKDADWLDRWETGNIGWHQPDGNSHLRQWWRLAPRCERVLVPLCGKSKDLLWLAERGHQVTGVELSPVAAKEFFSENDLAFDWRDEQGFDCFRARHRPISIYCGDYFSFQDKPFDALYDRAALVALPPDRRPAYAAHTRALLQLNAPQLLITLNYDQTQVAGPPFSVSPEEVARYWPELDPVENAEAIDTLPPKFHEAGLTSIPETIWHSRQVPP